MRDENRSGCSEPRERRSRSAGRALRRHARRRAWRVLLSLAALMAGACGGGGGGDGSGPTGPSSNQAPSATISAPADGSSFTVGDAITFEGSATDPEDGDLTGGSLVWSSDGDQIGTGGTFSKSDLPEGAHSVTLRATDSQGKSGTASVSITIASASGTQFAGSWKDVSVGERHACGLDVQGHAYCWGTSEGGDLGATLGSSATCPGPDVSELPCTSTPVPVSGDLLFSRITAGVHVSCGITEGGDAYCWGSNSAGYELGAGLAAGDSAVAPVKVLDPANGPIHWKSLRAGDLYACGISTADDLYCWGANNVGQAGGGLNADHLDRPLLLATAVDPNGANPLSLRGNVLGVAVGDLASCAVFDPTRHVLACWGTNGTGQLTVPGGSSYGNAGQPTYNFDGADTVDVGHSADCGLAGGSLYCWGSLYDLFGNDFAPGANLDLTAQGTPQLVDDRITWAAVTVSGAFGCALSSNGTAYCFGTEQEGELGNGVTSARVTTPALVRTTERFVRLDTHWVPLEESRGTTCGVTDRGEIYCWGDGESGSLGNGDGLFRNQNVPVRVVDPAGP